MGIEIRTTSPTWSITIINPRSIEVKLKMNISFHHPFNFYLDIVEIDEKIPAMRAKVLVEIEKFQQNFRYEGFFWMACNNWDDFSNALSNHSMQSTKLHDISENFLISLRKESEEISLSCSFTKKDINHAGSIRFEFRSQIDNDMLGKINSEFSSFPKWW
jgi:alkyl hydroperoxide reductase subunit AhpF